MTSGRFRSRSDIEVSEKLGTKECGGGFGSSGEVVFFAFKAGVGTRLKRAALFKRPTCGLKRTTGRLKGTATLGLKRIRRRRG